MHLSRNYNAGNEGQPLYCDGDALQQLFVCCCSSKFPSCCPFTIQDTDVCMRNRMQSIKVPVSLVVHAGVFLLFAMWQLLAGLFVIYLLPETGGIPLELVKISNGVVASSFPLETLHAQSDVVHITSKHGAAVSSSCRVSALFSSFQSAALSNVACTACYCPDRVLPHVNAMTAVSERSGCRLQITCEPIQFGGVSVIRMVRSLLKHPWIVHS